MGTETSAPRTNPRTLAAMQGRPTMYEVVAVLPGETFRLGFVSGRSKWPILELARRSPRNPEILAAAGEGTPSYSSGKGWTFGPVRICLSGRTEREFAEVA